MASQLKRVTADTDVTTVGTLLKSVTLDTDGTNAATVSIKDGTAAGGTAVLTLRAPGAGPSVVWRAGDKQGAYLASGIGADLTGTGAAVSIEFEQAE